MPHGAPTLEFGRSAGPYIDAVVGRRPSLELLERSAIESVLGGASYRPRFDVDSAVDRRTPNPTGDLDVIAGGSLTPFGPGQTFYMGLWGSVAESDVWLSLPTWTVTELRCTSSAPAGAGQSFVYTLRRQGIDQPITITISGASQTSAEASGSVAFAAGSRLCAIKVESSAGAAVASHTWTIKGQFAS